MKVDIIIVGQGLAGSILAWCLLEKQFQVAVIDNQHHSAASVAAAGLMNPITGKRLVKSWNVDLCLPEAVRFYRAMEATVQRPLYFEKAIFRVFHSLQERALWLQRGLQSGYQPYMGDFVEQADLCGNGNGLEDGGGYIRQGGYLNTRELLNGVSRHLRQNHRLFLHDFKYQDLIFRGGRIHWKHITADRIIFCEGYRVCDNPWFSWLPLQASQGDILTLKVDHQLPDEIINSGKWVLPMDADKIKVGATFQWRPIDGIPANAARQELLAAYRRMCPDRGACEVIEHVCGVRPGTRDKKPFIGLHPHNPQLGVFNGFGAKGSLLIPYYASAFTNFLQGVTSLPVEVDIARFN